MRSGALALGLLLTLGPSTGEPGSLPARNLAPQHLLLVQPPSEGPAVLARGDTAAALDLAYASIYAAQREAGTEALLDMEAARAALRLTHGLAPLAEVSVEIPFLWLGAGCFDDFLSGYHRTLGLPNGGREDAPSNAFRYRIASSDTQYAPSGGGGLGDIFLEAKRAAPSGRWALRALLKLPTGAEGRGLGSGSADGGAGLTVETRLGPATLAGSADLLFIGGTPSPALGLATHWAVGASGGVTLPAGGLGTATAQLTYFATPYDTGISKIDSDVLMLAVGLQRPLGPHGRLWLGFTEDLAVGTSPDISLFVGIEKRLGP